MSRYTKHERPGNRAKIRGAKSSLADEFEAIDSRRRERERKLKEAQRDLSDVQRNNSRNKLPYTHKRGRPPSYQQSRNPEEERGMYDGPSALRAGRYSSPPKISGKNTRTPQRQSSRGGHQSFEPEREPPIQRQSSRGGYEGFEPEREPIQRQSSRGGHQGFEQEPASRGRHQGKDPTFGREEALPSAIENNSVVFEKFGEAQQVLQLHQYKERMKNKRELRNNVVVKVEVSNSFPIWMFELYRLSILRIFAHRHPQCL